jgi:RNA polymerase sigma-70 factor, ECF subfamily
MNDNNLVSRPSGGESVRSGNSRGGDSGGSTKSMSDEILVSRYTSGDEDAFNILAGRWHSPVYNFVLRYMSSPDDAQDVTQKTFIKVYQKLHTLENPARFVPWMYRVALNQCRDEIRKNARSIFTSYENGQKEDGRSLTDVYQSKAADPERHLTEKERNYLIHYALSILPEDQRSVVIMKELQGLKFNEVADALSIPVNTAKTRMYSGLRSLHKIFTELNLDKEMTDYE